MSTIDTLHPIGTTSYGKQTYFSDDPEIHGETPSSGEFFVGDVLLVDQSLGQRHEPILVGEVVGFEVIEGPTGDSFICVGTFVHVREGGTILVGSNVEILSHGPTDKTWTQEELQVILKWGSVV